MFIILFKKIWLWHTSKYPNNMWFFVYSFVSRAGNLWLSWIHMRCWGTCNNCISLKLGPSVMKRTFSFPSNDADFTYTILIFWANCRWRWNIHHTESLITTHISNGIAIWTEASTAIKAILLIKIRTWSITMILSNMIYVSHFWGSKGFITFTSWWSKWGSMQVQKQCRLDGRLVDERQRIKVSKQQSYL